MVVLHDCAAATATQVLVAKGQYPEALVQFDDLLELDPSNLLAANNKALCLLYTCKMKEAIAFLEETIR